MKSAQLVSLGLVAVATAACGGGTAAVATKQSTPNTPKAHVAAAANSSSPVRCATGNLAVRLGSAGGAAGSVYEPIVFTNKGRTTCTLEGYPGVSFVAPQTGKQVGAAASRNPQHAARSVTLTPGVSASAMVQVAQEGNYPASACKPTTVSGLRIYPPGATTAAYVAFVHAEHACSSAVKQLSVQALVPGTSGR